MRTLTIAVAALVFTLTYAPKPACGAAREAQWRAVEEAIQKGLPRTAITNLEPIIAGALKDKAYGEAAKAMARQIVLEGNIQGNKPEEKITRIEAEIAKAPVEMKPLLDTILANWYWHYFQQNRWRFMQRTATAQAPGNDFTTWDLPRLFAEIDKIFTRALANSNVLKATPVSAFDDLLVKGAFPDTYRPTLYDFIAHEALKFYTSGEQAGARPQDATEFIADQPVYGLVPLFGAADEFTAGKIERRADESATEKALFLFRDLLAFHRNDGDPTAFADIDLARLVWAYNVTTGDEKNTRYKAALKTFVDKWADHEVSAMAWHHWGRVLQQEGDLIEARNLAQQGVNAHRGSPGGKLCHNLVQEIDAKAASISTERVWNKPLPKISVRYRNVTNIYFRAVAWDWNEFLEKRHRRPENLNDRERQDLLAKQPALAWSAELAPTTNYKERLQELPAPDSLRRGFYFIIASHDPEFSERNNQVTYTDVWVSDLALIVRPRNSQLEGFVLNAASGEPLHGADVQGWYLDNNGARITVPKVETDELGFFTLGPRQERHRGLLLRVRHGGDELASQQEYWANERHEPQPHTQTIFFTDRSLYRPGQTIQFKAICLRVDTVANDYKLLPDQEATVILADPNGKEVARQTHRCNDYGSFSGSFMTPAGRLTGQHHLRVVSGPYGNAQFNVEEYKRPKFQVTLDAPREAAKLNDKVALQGKAAAYTGAATDGALVKWRIVREVRFPWWCWWGWSSYRGNASQEIAHGIERTETDGTFKIEFIAKPDLSVSPTNEPTFQFSIFADVTDSAGETRSAQRGIQVGYTALQINITANDWQTEEKPVELTLRSATLDGEPQPAEGSLRIYRLKQPDQVQRAPLGGGWRDWDGDGRRDYHNPSDPNSWPLGDVVAEKDWTTDADGNAKIEFPLTTGAYRAMIETQDRFGKKVTARLPVQVLEPSDTKLAVKVPQLLAAPQWSLEPGDEFMALWGTGYDEGRAFIEVEHRQKMVQRFWTKPGQTQQQIKQTVSETMRGGFHLHVTQVRDNRAYLSTRRVEVPWSNKELGLKWEHFISKLQPAQKETWTLVISRPSVAADGKRLIAPEGEPKGEKEQGPSPPVGSAPTAERAAAELVAALYDESLDQFQRHQWMSRFGFFYYDHTSGHGNFENLVKSFQHLSGSWPYDHVHVDLTYRRFPDDLVANAWGYGWGFRGAKLSRNRATVKGEAMLGAAVAMDAAAPSAAAMPAAEADAYFAKESIGDKSSAGERGRADVSGAVPGPGPDLSQVTARKNLNETAFFFPHLLSDSNGVVRMQFTMPEALTQWRFLGFAHDKNLRSGFLEDNAVTSKELMVQPNPPRFLREGDELEFTVKVSNQSAARQTGKVKLTLSYAFNHQSADKEVGNTKNELDFDIPAKESRSFSWRLKVPDGCGFLTYKAVGSTGRLSDGEEGYLPVLSRRIFITESLPLPIRGPATKKFEFAKLLQSGKSKTLQHQSLTVQMVSQPAWYAVMALPYLMEFPHECTEQTFNRVYANALARYIANSDPKIRRVFDQWKNTPALDSPLEKNQDLKAVMLEETPWLRQAESESQARRNVGILFDENRLHDETTRTLQKLAEAQLADGSWPWFPGGRGNDYITLYITTGFGRLRHLGVEQIDMTPAIRSLARLDAWMDERYRDILKWPNAKEYVPSATDALSLYGRSFFLKDRPIAAQHREAVNFFLDRGRDHWLKVAHRQSQGHLAIALQRFHASALQRLNDSTPKDIMRSIKERSVSNEELGMFWRDTELSWWWYRAPIETQALMIEAFDEVMGDRQAVEECRVWLLKQKQTQDWKTTKATADAVYSLLLRGQDMLASDALVQMTMGGKLITPPSSRSGTGGNQDPRSPRAEGQPGVEPGTGFYEVRFAAPDIKPRLGDITIKKVDEGVSWGSVHWQYLEDMTKVTPHEGTPLKLKKSLYTKQNTTRGPVLGPVKGALGVGDELVVRVELRVDRDMEYVHLKDQRGSGTEPVNVLSRYRYQDGLAYYESTRDTASHFFIDYLPKGVYVFEYSTRVQHRGRYQTGIAEIQCMYAPEFNSHSESIDLLVQ